MGANLRAVCDQALYCLPLRSSHHVLPSHQVSPITTLTGDSLISCAGWEGHRSRNSSILSAQRGQEAKESTCLGQLSLRHLEMLAPPQRAAFPRAEEIPKAVASGSKPGCSSPVALELGEPKTDPELPPEPPLSPSPFRKQLLSPQEVAASWPLEAAGQG